MTHARSAKNQYLASLCMLGIAINMGSAFGWSSPSLPILLSFETPLASGPLTLDQASWVAAVISLGSMVAIIFYGYLIERFGRKVSAMTIPIPLTLTWVLIIVAKNEWYLYVSRICAGFAGGGVFIVLPIFITEISEARIRGFLGSLLVLSINFGILLMFIAGAYLQYDQVPWIFLPFPFIFLLLISFFPDTPVYLAKQNDERKAEESLRFYRGFRKNSYSKGIDEELKVLKELTVNKKQELNENNDKISMEDFTSSSVRRILLISFGLITLNQLSGSSTMVVYTVTIFEKAGSNLSPTTSAIVVALIQTLGTYAGVLLIERCGRKPLMIFSAFGNCLALGVLGTFCHLEQNGYDVSSWKITPLFSFCFMVFSANIGILSMPFLIMSEILPQKIKAVTTTFLMLVLNVFAFGLIKFLPLIIVYLNMDGTSFIFAISSLFGTIFVLVFLPETKGRSLAEISKLFEKHST